jgi:hypothetical protein
MRVNDWVIGVAFVTASFGCPRTITCPPGEVLVQGVCAFDCPPGSTSGCRDTGVAADAALEAGDVTQSPDVADVAVVPDVPVSCDGGEMACAGRCVSTQSDTMNCGACGNRCPTTTGSTASCVMGMCRVTCAAGYELVGGACEVIAPRPVFPPGTSTVTNLRPALKWALPMGVDGAEIELCRDRACSMVIERVTATGATARPMAELPRSSVVFWRVRGRVGAAAGTRTSATWQFRTRAASTTVDTAYGTELDVNGDGFTDLAVGAPGANGGAGAVRLYYGGPTGPSVSVSREITGNPAIAAAIGTIVTSAGDIDGDGFGDMLVAAPRASTGGRTANGQVLVFRGSVGGVATSPTLVLEGTSSRDLFGLSVSAAGDVNSDGFGDVVVGAPQLNMAGLSGIGEVALFYGSAAGLQAMTVDRLPGAYIVTGAADFDGDQLSDIAAGHVEVAVSGRPFVGVAFVLHGRAARGIDPTPRRVLQGVNANESFGWVSSVGDVDGDGYSDLAVAASLADPMGIVDAGNISLFGGGMGGLEPSAFAEIGGSIVGGGFGVRLGSVRDYARLARDCIVAGASRASPGGLTEAGEARMYSVSATRAVSVSVTLEGATSGESFGFSVSSGDYNGDLLADLAVGAPNKDVGGVTRTGAALVFPGTSAGFSRTASHAFVGRVTNEDVGRSVGSTL